MDDPMMRSITHKEMHGKIKGYAPFSTYIVKGEGPPNIWVEAKSLVVHEFDVAFSCFSYVTKKLS